MRPTPLTGKSLTPQENARMMELQDELRRAEGCAALLRQKNYLMWLLMPRP